MVVALEIPLPRHSPSSTHHRQALCRWGLSEITGGKTLNIQGLNIQERGSNREVMPSPASGQLSSGWTQPQQGESGINLSSTFVKSLDVSLSCTYFWQQLDGNLPLSATVSLQISQRNFSLCSKWIIKPESSNLLELERQTVKEHQWSATIAIKP